MNLIPKKSGDNLTENVSQKPTRRTNKFKISLLIASIFIFLCSSIYAYETLPTEALEVVYGGKTLGYVKNDNDFARSFEALANKVKKDLNIEVKWEERPSFRLTHVPASRLTSDATLQKNIFEAYDFPLQAASITVDGSKVCFVSNEETAQSLLSSILKQKENANTTVSFVSTIQIQKTACKLSELKQPLEAYTALMAQKKVIEEVELTDERSLWDIAQRFDTTAEEILEKNSLTEAITGQKIKIEVTKPLLSIKTVEKAQYDEAIAFDVQEQKDNTLEQGKRKTVTKGKEGKRNVTAEITRVDGEEIERNILSATVLEAPVEQTELVGTKPNSERSLASRLARPSYGTITSRFGRRWGTFHAGLDYGCPIGTPVNAAIAGKVTFAGRQSGYGNLVQITHDDGVVTYYGHLSAFKVKEGDTVEKGQLIALSGNTGRSTGPHLHFEVRKDGQPQDPQQYLDN